MPKPIKKKPKPVHRPMPEDPRQLAKAMFDAADRKTSHAGVSVGTSKKRLTN
ncbi:MAG: hypothetical protein OXN89_25015 [Bryobacterales bacterium]|nr:hypothetical protein [Bryobacterales bacterium]